MQVSEVAHLSQNVRRRDQVSTPVDYAEQQIVIGRRESARSFECLNPFSVHGADKQEKKQVRVDENPSSSVLREKPWSVQHQAFESSRIFMDVTSPEVFSTVNTL